MVHLSFLLIILFSTVGNVRADPFIVPMEEINKKGLYSVSQPGIPMHPDYKAISTFLGEFFMDDTNSFIKTSVISPRFKIFCPQKYGLEEYQVRLEEYLKLNIVIFWLFRSASLEVFLARTWIIIFGLLFCREIVKIDQ
jgi:hypothetical protein